MMGSVADILTDAGHDVTVVTPVIEESERNRTGLKSTKRVIFVEPTDNVKSFFAEQETFQKKLWEDSHGQNPLSMIFQSDPWGEVLSEQCSKVLSSVDLLQQIKEDKYDLAITEPFDLCAYAFFEAVDIRAHVAVIASSRYDHVSRVLGQPLATSYVPGIISGYSENMTIWERFMNILLSYADSQMFSGIGDLEFKDAQKILPIKRSWREVLPEASFVFTNQIPILDFPAPTFDKIIPIGGISVNKNTKNMKVTKKWDKVLNIRSKNVLISFGSNAKSIHMPDIYKNALLKVFESMPDASFIWKYENESDNLAEHLDNVYLGSWLPQNELLADKRLDLFVTHGGMASTLELSLLGKPCVMIPLFADQGRNAAMLKRHGGVEVLKKGDLGNSELIRETIEKVLSTPMYRIHAEELAEKMNNLPTDPRDALVKHVEFAARFGKLPSLDNYGRHLSLFTYYHVDIILISGVLVFFVICILVKTVSFFVKKWFFRARRWREEKGENKPLVDQNILKQ